MSDYTLVGMIHYTYISVIWGRLRGKTRENNKSRAGIIDVPAPVIKVIKIWCFLANRDCSSTAIVALGLLMFCFWRVSFNFFCNEVPCSFIVPLNGEANLATCLIMRKESVAIVPAGFQL